MSQTLSLLEEHNEPISLNATVLRKHVYAVHCASPLTLLEIQLANVLLQNAIKKSSVEALRHKRMHSIYLPEMVAQLRPGNRNRSQVWRCLHGLNHKQVEWAITEDSRQKRWGESTWLAGYDVEDGWIYYSYSANLVDSLMNPAVYARLNFSIQHLIRSRHTQSLYENCARYREWGQTKLWDTDTFRDLMGISEIKSYQKFKELRRSVITPAVEEINAKTEIYIEPEYFRRGKVVTSLRFLVRENVDYAGPKMPMIRPVSEQLDTDALETRAATYERLTQFGVEHSRAASLIAQFDDEHIGQNLDLVAERLYRQPDKINNVSGYAINAIESNYFGDQPDKQQVLDFESRNDREEREASERQSEAMVKLARFEKEDLPRWRAERWIGIEEATERRKQWDAFREAQIASTPFLANMFRQDTSNMSPWIAALWRGWIVEHCLDESSASDRQDCADDLRIDLEGLRRLARETGGSSPLTKSQE